MATVKKVSAIKNLPKHLLGIQNLSVVEAKKILSEAKSFIKLNRGSSKKLDILRGKTQINLSKNITENISMWDERLSSQGAFNLSGNLNINTSKKVENLDKNSAQFILQGALDYLTKENTWYDWVKGL